MLFIKRCIWLNSRIGKGCSIFFRVLKVRYLVPQDIVLYGTYLAAQQQYRLIQFPVCVGVLFSLEILAQASEKHIQTQFSIWQFRFWSITQPEMLCHVSMRIVLST